MGIMANGVGGCTLHGMGCALIASGFTYKLYAISNYDDDDDVCMCEMAMYRESEEQSVQQQQLVRKYKCAAKEIVLCARANAC